MRSSSYILFAIGSFAAYCTAADSLSPRHSQHIDGKEPSKSHVIEERSNDITGKQHIIWPKDGTDADTNSKTEDFLKGVIQQTNIYSYTDTSKKLVFWLVNVTDSQVGTIKQNAGVRAVQEDTKDELEATLPWPFTPAKLSVPNKFKRDDVQYTSQTSAASELVMISQPT